ncbi:MAG: PqqD family protein [Clostridia bacterium]|nr:PqqD family protein [Clostridia bacterium]
MKIKGEYSVREIAGETVVVPIGETVLKSNILAVLNETGKIFWDMLAKGSEENEIIGAICDEYEVDTDTVKKDLDDFVAYLKNNHVEVE